MTQYLSDAELELLPDWAVQKIRPIQRDLAAARAVVAVRLVLVGVSIFLLGITFGQRQQCVAAAPEIYGCPK